MPASRRFSRLARPERERWQNREKSFRYSSSAVRRFLATRENLSRVRRTKHLLQTRARYVPKTRFLSSRGTRRPRIRQLLSRCCRLLGLAQARRKSASHLSRVTTEEDVRPATISRLASFQGFGFVRSILQPPHRSLQLRQVYWREPPDVGVLERSLTRPRHHLGPSLCLS